MTDTPKTPTSTNLPVAPMTARGEQRREGFLRAAREIFLEKGYAGTSIDEVVQRTGGSKASIYKYFGNKESLFAAMYTQHCHEMLDTLAIPSDLDDDLETTLLRFARRLLSAAVDPQRIAINRALAAEATRFPDLAQMAYATGPKYGLGLIAAFMRRQHDAGRLHCANADIAAIQFSAMIKGHAQWRALLGLSPFPDHINSEDYIRESVRSFLRAHQP